MSKTKKKNHSDRTVSARTIILPAVISVVVILSVVTVFVHITNSLNRKLAQSLRDSAEYVEEISDFATGISILNETSSNFIVNPVDGEGNTIWGQIRPFAIELATGEHLRAKDLQDAFAGHDVSDETIKHINDACEDAQFFLDTQLHAIALVTSVYPLPPMEVLQPVAHLEITEEEAQMPAPARLGLAKSLVLNEDYAMHRKSLAASVNEAIRTVKNTSAKEIEETNRKVNTIRWFLWSSIALTVLILSAAFLAIYRHLVSPLIKASKLFFLNERLDESHGLKEFRIAATSYNNLLERRDHYEAILKSTAETDILTGLPNRYAFESFIKTLKKDDPIYPLCYYSFDLDYLKVTNDTYGHLSGDRLLSGAARIIKECFGDHCFRIGGDEFAAVIQNFPAENAVEAEKKFLSLLKKEGVSISFGSSSTGDPDEKTIEQMMLEADHMMYERKRILHANESGKLGFPGTAAIS